MRNSFTTAVVFYGALYLQTDDIEAFQSPSRNPSIGQKPFLAKAPTPLSFYALSTDNSSENAEVVKKDMQTVEEYRNPVTKVLSIFMQKDAMPTTDPFADIDFQAPKIASTTSLRTLAAALDYELIEKEWFVTGKVNPSYFSQDFEFQDPDVQVKGIEDYARGVYKIFDQSTSRAEIVSTLVNIAASTPDKQVITCTWRLSGNVNIAFGLTIKPYIVYTDFVVDPKTSLIVFQEDRFGLPPWDILLSALFPFLIGKVTSPPSPPVAKRQVVMPKVGGLPSGKSTSSPLDGLFNMFKQ